jgi:hypothetical protein
MAASSARLSRGQLVRAMLLAGLAGLVALLLESAGTLVKGWSVPYAWVLAAVLAVAGGMVSMLISLATDRALKPPDTGGGTGGPGTVYGTATVPGSGPSHAGGAPSWPGPGTPRTGSGAPPPGPGMPPRRRRTVPILTGVLVLLVLCGGGGAAIAAGVQRGVEFVRTKIDPVTEQGQNRLVEPVTERAGPLTVTVSSVEVTSKLTKVCVRVVNSGGETILLPGSFTQFAVRGRATISNRPLDNTLPDTVAGGGEIGGLLVFDGVPPAGSVRASLTFPNVGGFGAPSSVTVSGLRLAGPQPVTDC